MDIFSNAWSENPFLGKHKKTCFIGTKAHQAKQGIILCNFQENEIQPSVSVKMSLGMQDVSLAETTQSV